MEEFDIAVIGSGPGGYVAAIRAAQLGFKTVCIEKENTLGGTCLNVGCIPSKALLHSTQFYSEIKKEGKSLGVIVDALSFDFPLMMGRKEKIVSQFTSGIDFLFKKNKVEKLQGTACLLDANTIEVTSSNKKNIKAKYILLATGSVPISLPFLPFDEKKVLSSTGALSLKEVPKKLLVIGAGIIGVELGSVYSRLGSEVVFIEFLDRICPALDITMSNTLQKILEKQGMRFLLSHQVMAAEVNSQITLSVKTKEGNPLSIQGDAVLVAIGRKPYSEGLGLEQMGVKKDPKGYVQVNDAFRTSVSTVFAIGDLINGPMLAHKASEEGIAVVEYLANKKPSIDYLTIPSVAYTHPEVASVGFTEEEAKKYFSIKVGTFPFKANSRAKCISDDEGMVKIIADEKTHHLLGVHIIGPSASELIATAVVAMQNRSTVDDLSETCFAHPTLSEAIKEAALTIAKKAIHI